MSNNVLPRDVRKAGRTNKSLRRFNVRDSFSLHPRTAIPRAIHRD
jgi:hypothetical protein